MCTFVKGWCFIENKCELLLIKKTFKPRTEVVEGIWKYLGGNVSERIGISKDSNERHAWCAERIGKRLHEITTEWAGGENGKKWSDNVGHDKDTDFYSKWGSIRGFWTK